MDNKELGNTAVCMEEYAWKVLDTFDSRKNYNPANEAECGAQPNHPSSNTAAVSHR